MSVCVYMYVDVNLWWVNENECSVVNGVGVVDIVDVDDVDFFHNVYGVGVVVVDVDDRRKKKK